MLSVIKLIIIVFTAVVLSDILLSVVVLLS
jgi:hypothetical protein